MATAAHAGVFEERFDRDTELRTLRLICEREILVAQFRELVQRSQKRQEWDRARLLPLALHLREKTLQVIESIASWRRMLTGPEPFEFSGENYLLKLCHDLDGLRHINMRQYFCFEVGNYNPFVLPLVPPGTHTLFGIAQESRPPTRIAPSRDERIARVDEPDRDGDSRCKTDLDEQEPEDPALRQLLDSLPQESVLRQLDTRGWDCLMSLANPDETDLGRIRDADEILRREVELRGGTGSRHGPSRSWAVDKWRFRGFRVDAAVRRALLQRRDSPNMRNASTARTSPSRGGEGGAAARTDRQRLTGLQQSSEGRGTPSSRVKEGAQGNRRSPSPGSAQVYEERFPGTGIAKRALGIPSTEQLLPAKASTSESPKPSETPVIREHSPRDCPGDLPNAERRSPPPSPAEKIEKRKKMEKMKKMGKMEKMEKPANLQANFMESARVAVPTGRAIGERSASQIKATSQAGRREASTRTPLRGSGSRLRARASPFMKTKGNADVRKTSSGGPVLPERMTGETKDRASGGAAHVRNGRSRLSEAIDATDTVASSILNPKLKLKL